MIPQNQNAYIPNIETDRSTDLLLPDPVVFLRHSALQEIPGNIYTCLGNTFLLNSVSAGRLVDVLNTTDLGNDTGVLDIETKRVPELVLDKTGGFSLQGASETALELESNILGGIYINFLRQYGIYTQLIGNITIGYHDREIITAFYPDLTNYFTLDPNELTMDYRRFAFSVIRNNVGPMKVLTTLDLTDNPGLLLQRITFLKRVFRYFTRLVVHAKETDNMVHSPENLQELDHYRKMVIPKVNPNV